VKALRGLRDDKINNLRRCKPRPPTQIEGGVIPASTCEEIALYAVDTNSSIDALNLAVEIIEAEYKKLISTEEPELEKTPARRMY